MSDHRLCGTVIIVLVANLLISPLVAAESEPASGLSTGPAESVARLSVPASGETLYLAVDIPPDVFGGKSVAAGHLLEAGSTDEKKLRAQTAPAPAADGRASDGTGQLLAEIPAVAAATSVRSFRFQPASTAEPAAFRFQEESGKSLTILEGNDAVLAYRQGYVTAENVSLDDARRRRSCYIHPLWGLRGEVLTDDFPEDHIHHHGVFWAWPHVSIGGTSYDLWTYGDIEQRFVRWICREAGPTAAVLAVENGWFVGDRQVLCERLWLRVFRRSDEQRAIDWALFLVPLDRAVTLQGAEGKSYGGLTVRFAPQERSETVIHSPAGRAAEDLLDTPMAWADFTSRLGGASWRSGAAVLVHPMHPNYPPSWLARHYGAMCVGWPGVQSRTLEPGEPVRLDYRIWVHRAAVGQDDLARAHAAYAAAVQASFQP